MTTLAELEHVLDIPVEFEAILPGPRLHVAELMALSEGSLIRTMRPAGETVDVFAAGTLIGFAELVDGGERRGVRMVRFHEVES